MQNYSHIDESEKLSSHGLLLLLCLQM